ncbi:MAG: ROK family protein [Ginsengibacter sp.]
MMTNNSGLKILTIDIGGSHIKATILDEAGTLIQDYARLPTPVPSTPGSVLETISDLVKKFPEYDRISVGFPGYVKKGVIKTAPNLGTEQWKDYDLANALSALLKRPAKIVNDADLQGLGVASGNGLEMVVTLGTGFGTALLQDGNLLPHLELSRLPISKDRNYDDYIGEKAFDSKGAEHWNKRVERILEILKIVFNYDHLYVGGGNAKKINFKLDENITIVGNRDGIKGGAKLWKQSDVTWAL